MNRTIKSTVIVVSAAMLATSLLSCGPKNKNVAKKDEVVESLFAVNTYKTSEGNLDDYLEFGGDVTAVNTVDVMPDMAGKVSNVLVNVGDKVSKNQVIAYVDASRGGMYYAASPVRAPIAGRVTSLPATVGATVAQSSSLAKISRTDDLEVKINIAERFISRIENKQIATISFDAYPSVEFEARVVEISPVLDTLTRTMQVKLKFTKPDPRIKVGMYARVKLVTESVKNAIVIPSSAIVLRDQKPYVFMVSSQKNGETPAKVKLQPITVGIEVDSKTEVTEGLNAGDEIVVKGQSLLNDGSNVNIISVLQSQVEVTE